jgi:hypothetical protein
MRRPLLVGASFLAGLTLAAIASAAPLSETATPASTTLAAVTLNGDDQTVSWNETVAVSGVTQSLGYNVTAWAPVPVSGSNSLAALRVNTAPTLSCTQGSCTTGTNSVTTYPVVLGTSAGAATKIFGATVNTANKNQQAIVTFTIPVAADRYPGTYTTTITLSVANGP